MIFVNLKTYEAGTGQNALSLVNLIEDVSTQSQVKIIPVVQALDVRETVANTSLEVWIQNVDPVEFGANTGSILPEATLEDGAVGTFLNHSEKRLNDWEKLESLVTRCKVLGLKTLVFANNLEEVEGVSRMQPNFVSYEPGELVGNQSISVATAKPDIISQAVAITKSFSIPLIVGAGIHSGEDVKTSLSLGATGIAVASYVVESTDPRMALEKLAEGFK